MNSENRKDELPDFVQLFVYGTLRRGGVSAHLLQEGELLQQGLQLSSFAMFDAGWYPFVVPAHPSSKIVGDVFPIPAALVPALDEYEGEGYVRHFLSDHQCWVYLKADGETGGFEQVKGGDWLTYWKHKNK